LFSFPRTKRLTETRAFNAVFKAPTIRLTESKLMLLAKPNGLSNPRLGLAISKRHVKLACRRNRIKRVVRASFCMQAALVGLPHMDIIILSRGPLPVENNELLWGQLQALWAKLTVRLQG